MGSKVDFTVGFEYCSTYFKAVHWPLHNYPERQFGVLYNSISGKQYSDQSHCSWQTPDTRQGTSSRCNNTPVIVLSLHGSHMCVPQICWFPFHSPKFLTRINVIACTSNFHCIDAYCVASLIASSLWAWCALGVSMVHWATNSDDYVSAPWTSRLEGGLW